MSLLINLTSLKKISLSLITLFGSIGHWMKLQAPFKFRINTYVLGLNPNQYNNIDIVN